MFRQIRSSVLVAVAVGVLIGGSRPAVGGPLAKEFWQGERYKNVTGGNAKCLIKYLYDWDVNDASVRCPELTNCRVEARVGNYTVLKCSAAVGTEEVPDGTTATIKFKGSPANNEAAVLCAEFYSDDTCETYIGDPIPVGTLGSLDTAGRDDNTLGFKVRIKHDSYDWISEGPDEDEHPGDPLGPISGSEIYYAMWQEPIPEEDMTEDLWTCVDEDNVPVAPATSCYDDTDCSNPDYPYCGRCYNDKRPDGICDGVQADRNRGIEWRQHPKEWPQSFTINHGESAGPFNLGDIGRNKRVLFRYYTDLEDDQYLKSEYEVIQFRPRDIIPAVSEWGLLVIALLILAAGTVVIRRRRAMAA